MKHCSKCHKNKDKSEFNKNKTKKDGLQATCKECNKIASKKHYRSNKEKYIARNQKVKLQARKFILNIFLNSQCIDCGETCPACLQFDHVKGDKVMAVSQLVTYGVEAVKKEVEKCVIRCANCHAKKTAKDHGWYKKYSSIV